MESGMSDTVNTPNGSFQNIHTHLLGFWPGRVRETVKVSQSGSKKEKIRE